MLPYHWKRQGPGGGATETEEMLPAYIIEEIRRKEREADQPAEILIERPVPDMDPDMDPEEPEQDRGVAIIDFTV